MKTGVINIRISLKLVALASDWGYLTLRSRSEDSWRVARILCPNGSCESQLVDGKVCAYFWRFGSGSHSLTVRFLFFLFLPCPAGAHRNHPRWRPGRDLFSHIAPASVIPRLSGKTRSLVAGKADSIVTAYKCRKFPAFLRNHDRGMRTLEQPAPKVQDALPLEGGNGEIHSPSYLG